MVGNSRRGASVFGTTARIPTFLSFEFNLGVAYIEYNTIGTEGSSWEISLSGVLRQRAVEIKVWGASHPDSPCEATSRRAGSGRAAVQTHRAS
jgi:hypothetical protein